VARSLGSIDLIGKRSLTVEIAPVVGPDEFYRMIGHGLGADSREFSRLDLPDRLASSSLDGERWTLVVEEAHNLESDLFEEIRILSNRLSRPDGFSTIVLVGQTVLVRRLATTFGQGLAARLTAHLHLKPIDADEAALLLRTVSPTREWSAELVDRLHSMSDGIPSRLIALASTLDLRSRTVERAIAETLDSPKSFHPEPATNDPSAQNAPLIGPSKPPIRVEDGLIEVGWDPEDESQDDESDDHLPMPNGREPESNGEEPIDDRYAALQAWQEWAANQNRRSDQTEAVASEAATEREDAEPRETLTPDGNPNHWVDDEHGFAPFGRLFARPRLEHETD
jgi:general secretion pathway protein A